jgi:hypothetical protein
VPLDFETNHDPYYRLILSPDTRPHGFIHPITVQRLPWPAAFTIDDAAQTVTLSSPSAAEANSALQAAVDAAINSKQFPTLNGLHSEHFIIPGAPNYADSATQGPIKIERFTASLFGIATRGAHLTAYVKHPPNHNDGGGGDERISIWVARRSKNLFTYPGLLDSTVAGGVKASDTPLDCILAEADEEARFSAAFVGPRVRHAGVVTLANRNDRTGLFHGEILYVYDLDLSGTATRPELGDDGEVKEFVLMDWQEVLRRMVAGEFKPNVCPIMIDFFIRHGLISPDNESRYVEICARLRRLLPMPTNQQ